MPEVQHKFDHDKGQIHLQFRGAVSPLEALHWIFCFFSSIYVQFSKTSPLKSGESSEKSSGENRVKSCHVCGCHGFFGPEKFLDLLHVVIRKNVSGIFPVVFLEFPQEPRGLFKRGQRKGGIPHRRGRYNVCPQWWCDTQTVTPLRHHPLCEGTTKICATIA